MAIFGTKAEQLKHVRHGRLRHHSHTEMIFHLCYGVVITKFDLVFATKLLDPSNSFVVYDTFCVSKAITLIFYFE